MKLVLFQADAGSKPAPGLLTGRGVVDISGHVAQSYTPQLTMQGIIDGFDALRPSLVGHGRGRICAVKGVRSRYPRLRKQLQA